MKVKNIWWCIKELETVQVLVKVKECMQTTLVENETLAYKPLSQDNYLLNRSGRDSLQLLLNLNRLVRQLGLTHMATLAFRVRNYNEIYTYQGLSQFFSLLKCKLSCLQNHFLKQPTKQDSCLFCCSSMIYAQHQLNHYYKNNNN